MLATAGGIAASGADTVVPHRVRDGKSVRREIDLPTLFAAGGDADNEVLRRRRDLCPSRPVFYIYGEVQRPGAFRLERNMSVMQGLATGGGTSRVAPSRACRSIVATPMASSRSSNRQDG